ncbi:MAG: rRNA maturation RNase YbeY [Myxococcota bacterium]
MPIWLRSRGIRRRSVRHPEVVWRAEVMLDALGLGDAELSILLCDDATIRTLNRRYRDRNKSTDVLAFAMREGPGGEAQPTLLGDVVISMPTAVAQAEEHGRTIVDEVTFLLAHGLLHLLGHDHATPAEERDMSARTEALLEAVRAAGRRRKAVEKPR